MPVCVYVCVCFLLPGQADGERNVCCQCVCMFACICVCVCAFCCLTKLMVRGVSGECVGCVSEQVESACTGLYGMCTSMVVHASSMI